MQIHVGKYGAALELDDSDMFAQDEEIAAMAAELPKRERAMASRPSHGLSPILDTDDEGDYDDFDVSAYVGRACQ
jgi:hypothetical protein